jgi:hypothetical protein
VAERSTQYTVRHQLPNSRRLACAGHRLARQRGHINIRAEQRSAMKLNITRVQSNMANVRMAATPLSMLASQRTAWAGQGRASVRPAPSPSPLPSSSSSISAGACWCVLVRAGQARLPRDLRNGKPASQLPWPRLVIAHAAKKLQLLWDSRFWQWRVPITPPSCHHSCNFLK